MSRPGKGIWFSMLAVLLFLAVAISLAIKPTAQEPAISADTSAQVPAAVSTHIVLPTWTRMPPEPTQTPSPVPPPPAASTMQPVAGDPPNIAWGTVTDNSLTLWGGRYSDNPSPAIIGMRALAHWALPLDLKSMAASPDGRYLALLTEERCFPPPPEPTPTPHYVNGTPEVYPRITEYCLGDWPQYIYVLDLLTNEVQHVPSYSNYDLYARFQRGDPLGGLSRYWRILGWIDNDRFGVVNGSNQMVLATRDGVTFEPRNFPNLTGRDSISDIDLLPDRKTLVVVANGDLYLRDVRSGDIRKAGLNKRFFHTLSPDGASTAYIHTERNAADISILHEELWIQELGSKSADLLFTGDLARDPVWSPDSSQIAFTSVEARDPNSDTPTSDIFIADRSTKAARRLVDFQRAKNTNLRWTPGGNLLLLSTTSGSTDFSLVTLSTADGSLTKLATPAPGEEFRHPILFDSQLPAGMPPAGADPLQP